MNESSVKRPEGEMNRFRVSLKKNFVRYGEIISRRLGSYLAAQSTIPTTPYIDWHHIPEFKYLIDNADKIREEVKGILQHRQPL